jgi:outer membrane immunogenic protein
VSKRAISILLGAVFSVAASGLAFAADIAVKAPLPPPAPVFTWTGFYVGLSGGYNRSRDNVDPVGTFVSGNDDAGAAQIAAIPSALSTNKNGFIGGGQIGWNFQWYQFVVVGVEADVSGLTGTGSNSFNTVVPITGAPPGVAIASTTSVDSRLQFLGTGRGRIGFAFDRLLIFGTGGYAFGGAQSSTTITQSCTGACGIVFPSPATGATTQTLGGWAAGGGMEYSFGFWSVKAEYLHYDLGNMMTYPTTPLVGNSTTINVASTASFKGDLVRVGLNYQFHP